LRFAGRARQPADYVSGLNQPGNQPLPDHAGGAGKKYSHGTSSSCRPQRVIAIGPPIYRAQTMSDHEVEHI
jgi:hypothetical protein